MTLNNIAISWQKLRNVITHNNLMYWYILNGMFIALITSVIFGLIAAQGISIPLIYSFCFVGGILGFIIGIVKLLRSDEIPKTLCFLDAVSFFIIIESLRLGWYTWALIFILLVYFFITRHFIARCKGVEIKETRIALKASGVMFLIITTVVCLSYLEIVDMKVQDQLKKLYEGVESGDIDIKGQDEYQYSHLKYGCWLETINNLNINEKITITKTSMNDFSKLPISIITKITNAKKKCTIELREEVKEFSGKLLEKTSLIEIITKNGVAYSEADKFIKKLSNYVDIRLLHVGDTIDIAYNDFVDDDGKIIKNGEIVFGALGLYREEIIFFNYKDNKIDVVCHGRIDGEIKRLDVSSEECIKLSRKVRKSGVQQQFEDIVDNYMRQFLSAKNEVQQSSARHHRANTLSKFGGTKVSGWIGKLDKMSTDRKGYASISIKITKNIELRTPVSSDKIKPGTAIYEKLAKMEIGQKVLFSGSFEKSDLDYFKEYSLTINGSMTEPEYAFTFTDISAID